MEVMKVRYDVSYEDGFCGSMRFENQREAFDLAVKMAEHSRFGSVFMTRLTWNQNGAISVNTVTVKADGSFRKIN